MSIGINISINNLSGNLFNPGRLQNLKLWLDSSDSSTISLNGSKVVQWNDKSGRAFNVSNGTDANRPTLVTSSQNNLNAINFGASQWLDGGAGLISNGDTAIDILFVLKHTDLSATRVPFEVGNASIQTNNQHFRALHMSTGLMYLANISNDRQTVTGVISANNWYVLHYRVKGGVFSSTNPEFYKNGTQQTSSGGTGTGTPNINATGFRVGGRLIGGTNDALAEIGEVILVEGNLDSGTLSKTVQYLRSKWNI